MVKDLVEFIGAFGTAECFYMMGIEQTLPRVQALCNNRQSLCWTTVYADAHRYDGSTGGWLDPGSWVVFTLLSSECLHFSPVKGELLTFSVLFKGLRESKFNLLA